MNSSGAGAFMVACPLDALLTFTTFTEYTINIVILSSLLCSPKDPHQGASQGEVGSTYLESTSSAIPSHVPSPCVPSLTEQPIVF
jgi:hypothetical protein